MPQRLIAVYRLMSCNKGNTNNYNITLLDNHGSQVVVTVQKSDHRRTKAIIWFSRRSKPNYVLTGVLKHLLVFIFVCFSQYNCVYLSAYESIRVKGGGGAGWGCGFGTPDGLCHVLT